MTVEYRTWTCVSGIPFEDEASWLPLTRYLEREHPDLGPVTTWDEDRSAIVLILADDQPDPATAAEHATHVVSEALHAAGLADRSPRVFQIEPAGEAATV